MIAAGDAPWEAAAIGEIDASSTLRLVRRCVDVADLLAVARSERAAAAIVSANLAGLDVDSVHQLERAGVRVAAVDDDVARCAALGIVRLLRLGALDEVERDGQGPVAGAHAALAPLVAVWGPTGAPGRSTVSLELAASTASRTIETVLIDADTCGGALGQMLGMLDDVSGLVAACRSANQGRPHEVLEQLLDVDPGLRLLTGVPRGDMWAQVRSGALEIVLSQARTDAELVVVDCGFALDNGSGQASRNHATLHILEQAAAVVVVGRPEPVGLARLIRGLHDVSDAVASEPVIVVNQMRSSLGWSQREVYATLSRLTGREPAASLPFEQVSLDRAAMMGTSVRKAVPSSAFVKAMDAVVTHVLTAAGVGAVLGAARR